MSPKPRPGKVVDPEGVSCEEIAVDVAAQVDVAARAQDACNEDIVVRALAGVDAAAPR